MIILRIVRVGPGYGICWPIYWSISTVKYDVNSSGHSDTIAPNGRTAPEVNNEWIHTPAHTHTIEHTKLKAIAVALVAHQISSKCVQILNLCTDQMVHSNHTFRCRLVCNRIAHTVMMFTLKPTIHYYLNHLIPGMRMAASTHTHAVHRLHQMQSINVSNGIGQWANSRWRENLIDTIAWVRVRQGNNIYWFTIQITHRIARLPTPLPPPPPPLSNVMNV